MSFPGNDQDHPQRVSTAVNTAGFAQDVVMATSRVLHGQALTERDTDALKQCRELLLRMLSTDPTFARFGDRHLAETNTVALIRQTRRDETDANASLKKSAEAIDHLLGGDRDNDFVEQIRQLREIFLSVAEVNLAAMTRRGKRQEGSDDWTTLIANSLS